MHSHYLQVILQGAIPGVSVLSVLQLLSLGPQLGRGFGFPVHHGTTLLCWASASWKDYAKTRHIFAKDVRDAVRSAYLRISSQICWKGSLMWNFSKLVSRALCDFEIKIDNIKIRSNTRCLRRGKEAKDTVTLAKTVRCIAAECHWKQGVYKELGPQEEVQQVLTRCVLLILSLNLSKTCWTYQNLFDHLVFDLLPKLFRYCRCSWLNSLRFAWSTVAISDHDRWQTA